MKIRIRSMRSLAVCVAAIALSAVGTAHGAVVNLSGDYGLATWTSTSTTPVPFTTTNQFLFSPNFGLTTPFGSLSGDVVVNNLGGLTLGLSLTNVVFTASTPVSGGMTILQLDVIEDFLVFGPGNYTASHSLSGSWPANPGSAVSLGSSVINLDGTATPLPTIGGSNVTSAPFFNFSGPSVNGNTPWNVVSIQCSVMLQINNTGAINLPGSADVVVTMVPAPAGALALGFAGIACVRRRRPT